MKGRQGTSAIRIGLCVALAALAAPSGALAQPQRLALDHGLSIALPEGWQPDGRSDGRDRSNGLLRVHALCTTEACRTTLETCTFLMRRLREDGNDDAGRFAALYASPFSRYVRLRAVLKNTSTEAQLRRPLEPVSLGDRDWHLVETDARHGRKSGLFAETVIDGWYVGAICKSCETGEIRHQAAQAMLGTLSRQD